MKDPFSGSGELFENYINNVYNGVDPRTVGAEIYDSPEYVASMANEYRQNKLKIGNKTTTQGIGDNSAAISLQNNISNAVSTVTGGGGGTMPIILLGILAFIVIGRRF